MTDVGNCCGEEWSKVKGRESSGVTGSLRLQLGKWKTTDKQTKQALCLQTASQRLTTGKGAVFPQRVSGSGWDLGKGSSPHDVAVLWRCGLHFGVSVHDTIVNTRAVPICVGGMEQQGSRQCLPGLGIASRSRRKVVGTTFDVSWEAWRGHK